MTPKREAYLATISEKEKWCRKRLFELKVGLKTLKILATAPDKRGWLEMIKQIKYEITANRHELARMSGRRWWSKCLVVICLINLPKQT